MFDDDQHNNSGSATGFGLGTYIGAVLCFLAWGAIFFLAAYLAVLIVTAVGILAYWVTRRLMLMYRLYRLNAQRVPARRDHRVTSAATFS